jgi:membrane-bound metal-dependent hydrolase YbcI (DUF457 family)
MPLLVGHALAGATIYVAGEQDALKPEARRGLIAAGVLGALPDIDLVFPWILGLGVQWHGGFTHSILFACASGVLAAWILGARSKRLVLLLMGAALTHGFLDGAMKRTYSGAALLWPFSSKVYKLRLIDYFAFYPDSRLDPPAVLVVRALEISLYELLIFGTILGVVVMIRRWLRKKVLSAEC